MHCSRLGRRISRTRRTAELAVLGRAEQQSQHRVDPGARAGVLRLVNAQNDAVGASGSAVLSSVPLPGYQDLSAHAWIRVLFCLSYFILELCFVVIFKESQY